MAGLKRGGADANPYGSKYKDTEGGNDAGDGKRTYTSPTYTLFVTGIPDAESSDAVQFVFERDVGFMQSRPIGHKRGRRMVFVDYDSIENATKGLQAHQGHFWEEMDEGLKIDYDKDARSKRNTALDEGISEKFWSLGPRREIEETDSELFARLRAEAEESQATLGPLAAMKAKRIFSSGARLRGRPAVGVAVDEGSVSPSPDANDTPRSSGLVAYEGDEPASDAEESASDAEHQHGKIEIDADEEDASTDSDESLPDRPGFLIKKRPRVA